MGAGFGAVSKEMTEQNAAAKADARKDFETAQQTKLRQFEIARANAQNFQLHTANLHQQNDLDPIPASIASDIQKYKNYGDLAKIPGLDGIKAGDEYDAPKFVKLYNALLTSKVEVEKGWSNPEVSEDKDGKIVQRNAVNNETKPAIPAQVQKFQMDKANLDKAQKFGEVTPADRYKEQQANFRAELKAKQDATVNTDAFGNTSHLP